VDGSRRKILKVQSARPFDGARAQQPHRAGIHVAVAGVLAAAMPSDDRDAAESRAPLQAVR